jgi:hypothetical protein
MDVPEGSPLPASVASDLALLKLRLAAMTPDDISAADEAALGQEIGAIRLHLKRLGFEREAQLVAGARLTSSNQTRPASPSERSTMR